MQLQFHSLAMMPPHLVWLGAHPVRCQPKPASIETHSDMAVPAVPSRLVPISHASISRLRGSQPLPLGKAARDPLISDKSCKSCACVWNSFTVFFFFFFPTGSCVKTNIVISVISGCKRYLFYSYCTSVGVLMELFNLSRDTFICWPNCWNACTSTDAIANCVCINILWSLRALLLLTAKNTVTKLHVVIAAVTLFFSPPLYFWSGHWNRLKWPWLLIRTTVLAAPPFSSQSREAGS